MKTYHITYFTPENTKYSKGVNIEAESFLEAVASFVKDFDLEPFCCVEKSQLEIIKICETCDNEL